MGKKRTQRKYSGAFKISVILDMKENHLGYKETMRKYFPYLRADDFKFLRRWERIYLEEGAEGLMKERRGKVCAADGTNKGRPPKFDKKTKEDLIAENQRLRMEIEYLKKLDALVRKRELEEAKKQR